MSEQRADAQDVLDAPELAVVLDGAADPGAARAAISRILEVAPALGDELRERSVLRRGLVALVGASRALANACVHDPSILDALADEPGLRGERTIEGFRASARQAGTGDDDTGTTLRRWKRRELARIATRDLLGIADLGAVGRELAALASTCLQGALDLSEPGIPFAIIGMGKLGGAELNYSSDVDVLFVHEGDRAEAERIARRVLAVMTDPAPEGVVFRTDADLRPEGRAGALSRTVDGYRTWYEQWARPWEFQALIKARPVAGDAALGRSFFETSRPFVWPDVLDPDAVREIRTMKARAEDLLARKGLTERELKRGRGGIRDIEFAVQLLQLVHGRHDHSIRSATTLEALAQLAAGGYVDEDDSRRLADAYVFLRTVEHRLQLWEDRQTHTLPADLEARIRLARVLGYRDEPRATAIERFEEEHRSHQAAVRSIHERLFFAPILETLADAGASLPAAAAERLAAFGFVDTRQTRAALAELTRGLTRSSRVMQQLLPVILDWLSTAPDPDLGLLQLRRLVEGPTRAAAVATTFRDHPGAAQRTSCVLGTSRVIGDALIRQPEVVELLGDDDWLVPLRDRAGLIAHARETLAWRSDQDARRQGLRRFKRRELLRIAARDVLGLASVETTGVELAHLADACVDAALAALDPPLPFAVIGMGRLGGRELSYASDIDVLFVYDGSTPEDFVRAEQVATALMAEIGATTAEGQTFRIDANLRPEGRQGPLARSLAGYAQYYERWALPWEQQSLLRARPIAGDGDLAERFMALATDFAYQDPFPEESVREIRRVKARVERERIPPGEDPQFHLKLGKGALTDVEFTVQLLQLVHGAGHPEVRATSTTDGLERLREAGLLDPDDADVLDAAYRFCERARNARFLTIGRAGDALPQGGDAVHLARMLGYTHRPEAQLRDDYRRVTRRARRVIERVFYGQE